MASCHSAKIKQDGIIYRSTTSLSGHEIARLILSRLRETFESYRSIGAFAISWRILGIGTRELAFDTLHQKRIYICIYIRRYVYVKLIELVKQQDGVSNHIFVSLQVESCSRNSVTREWIVSITRWGLTWTKSSRSQLTKVRS